MEAKILRAHFDGNQIQLDDPFPLEPNTPLLITILPKLADDRDEWMQFSMDNLNAAYGNDEPDYSSDVVKEANPEYEGG